MKALFDYRESGLSMHELGVILPTVPFSDTRNILKDQPYSQLFRSELNEDTLTTKYWLSDSEVRRIRILVGDGEEVVMKDTLLPTIHQGTMGTSLSTVEAGLSLQDWELMARDTGQRELVGLEMEGYGVYSAVAAHQRDRHDHKIQAVLVKGVSDLADADKTDRFHAYCKQLSAAFVKRFLILHGYESSLRFGHPEFPPVSNSRTLTTQREMQSYVHSMH